MILTPEIERLEATDWKEAQSKENAKHDIAALRRMRQLYPALDYADELLDNYSRMTNHYHSLACGDEECMPLCREAQALLKKIEGKK